MFIDPNSSIHWMSQTSTFGDAITMHAMAEKLFWSRGLVNLDADWYIFWCSHKWTNHQPVFQTWRRKCWRGLENVCDYLVPKSWKVTSKGPWVTKGHIAVEGTRSDEGKLGDWRRPIAQILCASCIYSNVTYHLQNRTRTCLYGG